MMNGILLVDKPQGFTSFDVIAKLRGIVRQKKIGHAGTLDPMATGVLPCLLGSATRLCDLLPREDKLYCADVQLGLVTDTQDITGTVLSRDDRPVSRAALEAALPAFRGELDQIPPMYSALSVGGQRLYDLARAGREIERPARRVTVLSLELLAYDEPARVATLEVRCSKGTYIRTLAHDLGALLGPGATLSALRRTEAGGFLIADCFTLEQIQRRRDENSLESCLLPCSAALETLPRLDVGEWQSTMLQNGVPLRLDKLGQPDDGRYTLWHDGHFLGLGVASDGGMRLR
ncbi:MAG: tRNA pseudouridine(55) synthase TruB, partial [Oscillospiraceae bacterium]